MEKYIKDLWFLPGFYSKELGVGILRGVPKFPIEPTLHSLVCNRQGLSFITVTNDFYQPILSNEKENIQKKHMISQLSPEVESRRDNLYK